MGSKNFNKQITSRTAEDGFKLINDEATFESGHDTYNGTINTCDMGGCVKRFDKLNQTTLKQAEKIVAEYLEEKGSKGVAYYINCGVEKMQLITVESKKGTYKNPIYKEKHLCYVSEGHRVKEKEVAAKDTLKAAKEFSIDYALKHGKEVDIRKERTLVKGETTVAEVVIKRRDIKIEPKTLKSNQKIEKYYRYIFFGSAFY
jgi:hypothetical protein